MTLKPELVLVSVADDKLNEPLPSELLKLAPGATAAPARLELELQDLAEEDRQAFVQDGDIMHILSSV